MTTVLASQRPSRDMGFAEFVVLMAALMALGALGIDSMLPNLPAIGRSLAVADENRRQLIITTYLLGLGGFQLIYGPLSDRFGRRLVLLAGLCLYIAFSLLAALSPNFNVLLAARVLQGAGAAATRSIPLSIIRDRFEGRAMARVMSLTSMVFMAAPVAAPSLGQLVLVLSSWPWLFGMLAALAASTMMWAVLRLPETLHSQDRLPIQSRRIAGSFATAMRNRTALAYTVAQTLLFGGLLGFINSAQQVVAEALGAGDRFAMVFAICASFIAVASLVNARLVMRLGMRRLSHAALLAFIASAAVHLSIARSGHETLAVFVAFQALNMFCFGLTAGNFLAMAMEPMGHLAGVASAFQGFVSMVGATLIGFAVGQRFNGTVAPVEAGYLICGLLALAAVLVAERGRLFRPHEAGGAHSVVLH
ncbi:MAG TPA: multidrug effflux MFS transporter [Caulobacteraceae bacterium]|nr:multidrug effflux MFS transporter [Caulobacteraceae bacterium]